MGGSPRSDGVFFFIRVQKKPLPQVEEGHVIHLVESTVVPNPHSEVPAEEEESDDDMLNEIVRGFTSWPFSFFFFPHSHIQSNPDNRSTKCP